MSESKRVKVAVVYGGRSSEHSISCVSAGSVIAHLDPQRYEVYPIGITNDGVWTVGENDPSKLAVQGRTLPQVTFTEEVHLGLSPARRGEFRFNDGSVHAVVDVILPILHGMYGEDGTIQGLFELSGVPYVGTGVLSSACAMDKEYAKKLLAAEGIPVGREVILKAGQSLTDAEKELLGLPVFVKPARGGSSIGISRVTAWEDLEGAIAQAREHDVKVIVESEIIGSEVECGVLQYPDGSVHASVTAQLADTNAGDEGFYGFETKYLENVVTAHIPAPLPEETNALIQRLSLKAFAALDCVGIARVDFFVTAHGPVLNEVNTMPGFTPASMYPQMWAKSGLSYPELLDTLIASALARSA